MTPISSAAGTYGRVAASTQPPVDRPAATQTAQAATPPPQRPSAVVNISPQARERAEAVDRNAESQGEAAAKASPRAQAATLASQNQFAQAAAAENAGGNAGGSNNPSR